ncbi:hypothetical protein [Parvibaculum sp.]|uniref:hypothetical protein n=1 Tax=Parvibaculum sp. TaxID=2024848 RepID=UPI003918929E
MIAHILLFGSLVAGFALPAAAGEVRWIDPWSPEVEHGALAGGPEGVDPFAGEREAPKRAEVASVATAGFEGGVGNRQGFIAIHNGFYVKPSLPAGQAAMTGARAAPVHPRGGVRF